LDFSKFQSLKPHLLDEVEKMLTDDIAKLMEMIPLQDLDNHKISNGDNDSEVIKPSSQTVIEGS